MAPTMFPVMAPGGVGVAAVVDGGDDGFARIRGGQGAEHEMASASSATQPSPSSGRRPRQSGARLRSTARPRASRTSPACDLARQHRERAADGVRQPLALRHVRDDHRQRARRIPGGWMPVRRPRRLDRPLERHAGLSNRNRPNGASRMTVPQPLLSLAAWSRTAVIFAPRGERKGRCSPALDSPRGASPGSASRRSLRSSRFREAPRRTGLG